MSEVCVALGHLHDPRALPDLLGFLAHPNADVRFGVVSGLSGYEDPGAIAGLITLSNDADARIRDWATFGLGQMIGTDTPAIRAALRARLDDPCPEARDEAVEGLATRGDLSIIPVLDRELRRGVSLPLLDAAASMASPELCPALDAAAERGLTWEADGRSYDLTESWTAARRACDADTVADAG